MAAVTLPDTEQIRSFHALELQQQWITSTGKRPAKKNQKGYTIVNLKKFFFFYLKRIDVGVYPIHIGYDAKERVRC
jgi:hypothetical protein